MTVGDIKNRIMYQTGNDGEDVTDHLPWVLEYINQAYNRMLTVYKKKHVGDDGYPLLSADTDEPVLPQWAHYALADFATWCIYRNGSAQRQQRGMRYLASFEEAMVDLHSDPASGEVINFYNIP